MRRPTDSALVLLATLAGCVALLADTASAQAQATRLYACVKKDGAAHIYAKKPRCRHAEKLLVWNSEGPPGHTGAPGASGAGGTNGSNALVSALLATGGTVEFASGERTLVSRSLPAGDYLVDGYVYGDFSDPAEAVEASGYCALEDTPVGGTKTSQSVGWEGKAGFKYYGGYHFAIDLPLVLTVLSPSAGSTITLSCESGYNSASKPSEFHLYFANTEIAALEVGSVG